MASDRSAYQRRRRAELPHGTCPRCFKRPAIEGRKLCAFCVAQLHERKRAPDLLHDTELHAAFIEKSKCMEETCEVSGYSLLALKKIGEELTIDRVDSTRGYCQGNMRLLARSLNQAKSVGLKVPGRALNRLLRRLERLRNDKWTPSTAQTLRS